MYKCLWDMEGKDKMTRRVISDRELIKRQIIGSARNNWVSLFLCGIHQKLCLTIIDLEQTTALSNYNEGTDSVNKTTTSRMNIASR